MIFHKVQVKNGNGNNGRNKKNGFYGNLAVSIEDEQGCDSKTIEELDWHIVLIFFSETKILGTFFHQM